jgi:hypothetical protein
VAAHLPLALLRRELISEETPTMKNIVIASAIALASLVGTSVTSEAAPMHHHCWVKTVKHHVHGHWVVRKERVCK